LIIVLIATAIVFSILGPVFNQLFDHVREAFVTSPDEIVRHPILAVQNILKLFTIYFAQNASYINMRLVFVSLIIIFTRFLINLPLIPINKIMYSKLTTNFDQGLLNAVISTLPISLLYSLLTSVVLGIVDFAIGFGLIFLATWLIQAIGFIALPISLALALFIYTLRFSLLSQWLPEIAKNGEKNIFIALKHSFTPLFKNFEKNFICLSVSTIIFISIILGTIIPTFGLVPVLMLPTFIVFYITLNITLNFSFYRKKYFIDNGVTIYNPTKLF